MKAIRLITQNNAREECSLIIKHHNVENVLGAVKCATTKDA